VTLPRPWRAAPPQLPPQLARALGASPGEPRQTDLEALASRLSGALGVPLTAPSLGIAAQVAGVTAKPTLAIVSSLAIGVAVGVGLSAVVSLSLRQSDPAPSVHSSASARSLPDATPSAPQPAPRTEPVASAASAPLVLSPRPRVAAGPQLAPPLADPLAAMESELSLLRQARAALASEPSRALALCDEHARSFGNGALVQEREVIAIDALVHSGRLREARERGRDFSLLYPSSAHAPRLEALLGKAAEKK
jgi:hypothetical protein